MLMKKERPIIGIVGRPNEIISGYSVLSVDEKLKSAIIKAGGIPIMIIPTQTVIYDKEIPKEMTRLSEEEKKNLDRQLNLCSGIVLPGGNKWYEYDVYIANYVIENNIPTLGLCMGMQLLAYVDCMSINNDLNLIEKNNTIINHFQKGVFPVHEISIVDNTVLKKILNCNNMLVNSRHNYHITKVNKAIISAYSNDNLIEGIEFPDKKYIIAVQWHPESIIDKDPKNQELFNWLINFASKK